MNTPAELTDTELKRLACLDKSHVTVATLTMVADDGRSYTFATAQFLDGLHEGNNSNDAHAPRERLMLRFTTAEAIVLGSRLDGIQEALGTGCLRRLKTIQPRHASALKSVPVILSIIVNRKDEL